MKFQLSAPIWLLNCTCQDSPCRKECSENWKQAKCCCSEVLSSAAVLLLPRVLIIINSFFLMESGLLLLFSHVIHPDNKFPLSLLSPSLFPHLLSSPDLLPTVHPQNRAGLPGASTKHGLSSYIKARHIPSYQG